jgi:hypothetical protein
MTTAEVKSDLSIETNSVYHNCEATVFQNFGNEFFESLPQNLFLQMISNMRVIL